MVNIASSCWLNIAIGWGNLTVFILVAFDFYKNYRGQNILSCHLQLLTLLLPLR